MSKYKSVFINKGQGGWGSGFVVAPTDKKIKLFQSQVGESILQQRG